MNNLNVSTERDSIYYFIAKCDYAYLKMLSDEDSVQEVKL